MDPTVPAGILVPRSVLLYAGTEIAKVVERSTPTTEAWKVEDTSPGGLGKVRLPVDSRTT
jgi:hypothetical protein